MNALRESVAAVRTQIEDLQAEMEAAARCADHIHTDMQIIDGRSARHSRLTTRFTSLLRRADELKKSIEEQQALLRDLRTSFGELRRSLHRGSK